MSQLTAWRNAAHAAGVSPGQWKVMTANYRGGAESQAAAERSDADTQRADDLIAFQKQHGMDAENMQKVIDRAQLSFLATQPRIMETLRAQGLDQTPEIKRLLLANQPGFTGSYVVRRKALENRATEFRARRNPGRATRRGRRKSRSRLHCRPLPHRRSSSDTTYPCPELDRRPRCRSPAGVRFRSPAGASCRRRDCRGRRSAARRGRGFGGGT